MLFRKKPRLDDPTKESSRCSFCNKLQRRVRKLIKGPEHLYICDECVQVCVEILADDQRAATAEPPHWVVNADATSCALCGMMVRPNEAVRIRDLAPLCVTCVRDVEVTAAAQRRGQP